MIGLLLLLLRIWAALAQGLVVGEIQKLLNFAFRGNIGEDRGVRKHAIVEGAFGFQRFLASHVLDEGKTVIEEEVEELHWPVLNAESLQRGSVDLRREIFQNEESFSWRNWTRK